MEADLVEALQEFGTISSVVVMPKKRQALVEFEDVLGACNAVNYAADNQIYIAGHPAFVNYSTSQKISRPGDSDDSRSVNSVLLFTILNPIYSITTVRASSYLLRFFFCIVSLLPFLPVPSPLSQTDWPVPFHLWFLQDVLYTICNPCGPVQRTVILQKNGFQAMVDFMQPAGRAKASLTGLVCIQAIAIIR